MAPSDCAECYIEIIPWNDSFNTGIDEIDEQHQKLLHILNKIASYITFHKPSIQLNSVIDELLDYTTYHFKTEDDYWLNLLPDAPQVKLHRKNHHFFITRLNEFKTQMESMSGDGLIDEMLSFLAAWLTSHILESDRHMAFLSEAVQSGKGLDEANQWANEQIQASNKVIIGGLAANTLRLMREIKASDITLSKLSDSEEHLEEAMDYAKIGRWSFPYQGSVADWSPQMFDMFGLEPNSVPGPETLCGIMQDGYQGTFLDSMKSSFETGDEHHVEYPIIRPSDGEVRWIECRGKIIYKDDGTPEKISGFVQDITERKDNEQRIIQLAYYDTLTLLPNRRLLFDRLNQALVASDRHESHYALLYLDLDNFKSVNDSYGHDYGDILLQQVATRITNCIRMGDTLARIGGDEFVVLVEELDNTEVRAGYQAETIAHKILISLSKIYYLNELQYSSSASIGIVLFNDRSVAASELMKQADIAMYQAKQSGHNMACFFDPKMQKDITARVILEAELRTAIIEQQFELFYQPQVDNLNRITGAEALVRWRHPTHGLTVPDVFVPIAEDTGLIIPIGEWVLEAACAQLGQWQREAVTSQLSLSVNVSYKQFRQPNFVAQLSKLVEEYHLQADKLCIELTETVLIDDMEVTVAHMRALRNLGIRFSLDDFGTGYSSLQYLKRLPLSQLKIDRSFISDVQENVNDRHIVETIISMANALRLNVIAEGVETREQADYLINNGCLALQGHLFGRPLPIGEFEVLCFGKSSVIQE